MDDDRMISTSEACARLGISRQAFWQTWVARHGLKPVREHGRKAWFSEQAVLSLAARIRPHVVMEVKHGDS